MAQQPQGSGRWDSLRGVQDSREATAGWAGRRGCQGSGISPGPGVDLRPQTRWPGALLPTSRRTVRRSRAPCAPCALATPCPRALGGACPARSQLGLQPGRLLHLYSDSYVCTSDTINAPVVRNLAEPFFLAWARAGARRVICEPFWVEGCSAKAPVTCTPQGTPRRPSLD